MYSNYDVHELLCDVHYHKHDSLQLCINNYIAYKVLSYVKLVV